MSKGKYARKRANRLAAEASSGEEGSVTSKVASVEEKVVAEESAVAEKSPGIMGPLGTLLSTITGGYLGYREAGPAGGIEGATRKGGKAAVHGVVSQALFNAEETKNLSKAMSDAIAPHKELVTKTAAAVRNGHAKLTGKAVVTVATEKAEGSLLTRAINGIKGKAGEFKTKISTSEGRAKLGEGGVSAIGDMALLNSLEKAGGDGYKYFTGKKEATMENWADTSVNTLMAADPIRAVTSMIPIKAVQNINLETGASYLMGQHGESFSDISRDTMNAYHQANDIKAGTAHHRHPVPASAAPSMNDYAHLGGMHAQIAQYVPGGKIDGHDVAREFNKIDMTKPQNYRAYNIALNRAILDQEKIMSDNSSWIPRTMRSGAGADRYNEAELQHSFLIAAQEENGQFLTRVHKYNHDRDAKLQEQRTQALASTAKEDPKVKHATNGKGHEEVDHDHVRPSAQGVHPQQPKGVKTAV